jgi:uncharacterized repeat protein (TIGR03806 family)
MMNAYCEVKLSLEQSPRAYWIALACSAWLGCAGDPEAVGGGRGVPASAYENAPETLEGWNLFEDVRSMRPGPRTLPYDVIAPLFADYAQKQRFLYLPENKTIRYEAQDAWQLPSGSILVKTFSYPNADDSTEAAHLLETRLLVFAPTEVQTHTYVFTADQTSNARKIAGTSLRVSFRDLAGEVRDNSYRVPNTNQCLECHAKRPLTHALGVRTRQLDRDFDYGQGPENQLDHMREHGWLDRAPEPAAERQRLVDPFGDAPLAERARAYLDSNCSQCHMPAGDAGASGLWIDWDHTGPDQPASGWGACKRPTSASGANCGHDVDIVPGDPERSIYICRMQSNDPKVQMPPLGRTFVHTEAVALLQAWIAGLEGGCD